jgi:hypothetical protein
MHFSPNRLIHRKRSCLSPLSSTNNPNNPILSEPLSFRALSIFPATLKLRTASALFPPRLQTDEPNLRSVRGKDKFPIVAVNGSGLRGNYFICGNGGRRQFAEIDK